MTSEEPDQVARSAGEDRDGRQRSGWRWIVRLFVVVALLAAAAGSGWVWFRRLLDGPVSSRDFAVTLVIARGTPYRAIVEQLRSAGLLRHPFAFDYLAWRHGKGARLKPGRYQLRSTTSLRQIYETMVRGAPIRITVPEGWTVRQIAARLVDEGLLANAESFTSATSDARFLARHSITAPSAEGYVLPETYFFDPGVTAGEVLETMVGAFERHYAAEAEKPRPASLSWNQVLTLASMIEREARNDSEKSLIASVYCNRLRRGMTLDCDATVRYALTKWREPLTRSDLKTSSPFNTYLYKGLPPGPIACVGDSSIAAALSPAQSDYLYYCYRGDQSHEFSKTAAEHERAVEKFLRKGLTGKAAPQ
jgi:UPF0755 protein